MRSWAGQSPLKATAQEDHLFDCLAVVVFVKFLHCKVDPPSHLFFFLIFKFILFLAVLGLRCGA